MSPDYKQHDPKGWCGDPKRGAAMGRHSYHEEGFSGRLYIRKVRLDSGGYDPNGTYFGHGEPLYWISSEGGEVDFMVRAGSRTGAAMQAFKQYPNAKIRGVARNSDEIRLEEMRALGVRWPYGDACPTYPAKMSQADKAEADAIYDAMTQDFIDQRVAYGRRGRRTSGQAICIDHVIREITKDLEWVDEDGRV